LLICLNSLGTVEAKTEVAITSERIMSDIFCIYISPFLFNYAFF